jgi:poly(A) polymerase
MNLKSELKSHNFINKASELADKENIKLYLVGGYIRDILLRRNKTDLDFLVIGDGIRFAKLLAGELKVGDISVFKSFGTAHFRYDNYDLEFVGSRKESYSSETRNPVVVPGTFSEDISRRDFTINTLAVSLNSTNFGEVEDTYGGLDDIRNKLIRTPLDPMITFNDDPLRILRAFRFSSQLNFDVVPEIHQAAGKMKDRLNIIAQERITDELLRMLASEIPSKGLILLFETRVLEVIFPEISNLAGVDQRQDYHHKDVFYHTIQVVDNVARNSENVWLRFAALVHDIAKPQTKKFVEGIGWTFHGHDEIGARMMKNIFKRMKLPLHQLHYIETLVRLHLRPIALAKEEVTDSAIRRLIVEAGEYLEDLITLCRADITSKNPGKVTRYLENYEKVMKKVWEVEEKDKLRNFQSPVRGETIMEVCNLKPSPKVGEIKSAIEDAILDGKIGNNYEEAFTYLLKIKDKILDS